MCTLKEFIVVYRVVCNKVIQAENMNEAIHLSNKIRAGDEHSAVRVIVDNVKEYENLEPDHLDKDTFNKIYNSNNNKPGSPLPTKD
jgi:hypothetical protein